MSEVSEVTPSMNRGPGCLNFDESWRMRNTVSNLQTANKKLQLATRVSVNTASKQDELAKVVGGKGLQLGGYVGSRHNYGPKGKAIGPTTRRVVSATFSAGIPAAGEIIVRDPDVMPKYNVGAGFPEGINRSKGFDVAQAARVGFKSQLPGPVDNARGLRMTDKAVDFISIMELEFQAQYGRAPNDDELKATVQLSLMNGFGNRHIPFPFRIPVNNDYDRF